jgi:hypothetical protein
MEKDVYDIVNSCCTASLKHLHQLQSQHINNATKIKILHQSNNRIKFFITLIFYMIFSTECTKSPQPTATQIELRRPEILIHTITTKCILLVNIKKDNHDTLCQYTRFLCQFENTKILHKAPFVKRYMQSRQILQSVSGINITGLNNNVQRIVTIICIKKPSIQILRHQYCCHRNYRISLSLTYSKIKVSRTTQVDTKRNESKAAQATQLKYQSDHRNIYQLQSIQHQQRHNRQTMSKPRPYRIQPIPKVRPNNQILFNYQVAPKSQLYCTKECIVLTIGNKAKHHSIRKNIDRSRLCIDRLTCTISPITR